MFQGKLIVKLLKRWGIQPSQFVSMTTDGASDARKSAGPVTMEFNGPHNLIPSVALVCFAHATSLVVSDSTSELDELLLKSREIVSVYNSSGSMHLLAKQLKGLTQTPNHVDAGCKIAVLSTFDTEHHLCAALFFQMQAVWRYTAM